MPPKRRVTDIGIVGSKTPAVRKQYSGTNRPVTIKRVKRTPLDEIVDAGGSLDISNEERQAIEAFLKSAARVKSRTINFIKSGYKLTNQDINKIQSLLRLDEGGLDKERFINSLTIILKNRERIEDSEGQRGLSSDDSDKIMRLLTYADIRDIQLEIGYLLRHPDYGVDSVMGLIQDNYLTLDQLPHLDESNRLLYNQLMLAFNPVEGIPLLECPACKEKTYTTQLITNRAWDEAQSTRDICYNNSCSLYRR